MQCAAHTWQKLIIASKKKSNGKSRTMMGQTNNWTGVCIGTQTHTHTCTYVHMPARTHIQT